MLARKMTWGVAVVSIMALLLAGQSLSQPAQQGQRAGAQGSGGPMQRGPGQGPGQGPGGPQFDPAQMRQMMEQRMQEMLGATAEEWKVLGPRVMKVQELARQSGGGPGVMFGPMGRRGAGGPGGPGSDRIGGRGMPMNRELTEVEKIQEELQTLLETTTTTPEQIKQQVTKLRAAREKARQELAKAQQDLRQILTVRQEAQLILMGMLD